jgi:DNA-directed RNA polymerase subunit M/transcription elongation factor TFIIS
MVLFYKKKMKIRKKAVQVLQSKRGLTLTQARSVEEKIWAIAPESHQRIVRLLLVEKNKNINDILKMINRDVKVQAVKNINVDDLVEEGAVSCRKCGCNKVQRTELQTRSSDESATLFFRCTKCKARWKK